jgi:predicted PhzF superfamily epimerase YddE/YHI9
MTHRYLQLDVFAARPGQGNPLGVVAAWLYAQGRLPGGSDFVASQGRELGRDGRVHMRVEEDGNVWIGGHVQQVIDGWLDW